MRIADRLKGSPNTALMALLVATSAYACAAPTDDADKTQTAQPAVDDFQASVIRGRYLFDHETFGGNGRTCKTCHTTANGTITLEQIQEAYADDPNGPLFRAIDSDDGTGASYNRLLTEATFRVTLDLPAQIVVTNNPSERQIHLFRNPLTTNDSPALDPLIMWDVRASTNNRYAPADLKGQALAAIHDHLENTVEPTDQDLQDIANFETDQLFSSRDLYDFAHGGPLPDIPKGYTDSEKRGHAEFEVSGRCGFCHASSLSQGNGTSIPPLVNGAPADGHTVPEDYNAGLGFRDGPLFISELTGETSQYHPYETYTLTRPDGSLYTFTTRDPGMVIPFPAGATAPHLFKPGNPVNLVGRTKIPNLRNLRHTAPYFHDGSAKTLGDVVDHYSLLFQDPRFLNSPAGLAAGFNPAFAVAIPDDVKADIIAYMEIL